LAANALKQKQPIQRRMGCLCPVSRPRFSRVTFDGKIRSDGTQPSKPVCDWSVGPWGGEVKDEFPTIIGCLQLDHGYTSYAGSLLSTSCGQKIFTCGKHARLDRYVVLYQQLTLL